MARTKTNTPNITKTRRKPRRNIHLEKTNYFLSKNNKMLIIYVYVKIEKCWK